MIIASIFEALLHIFGILWPALGAILCIAGAFVCCLFAWELWDACVNRFYDGTDSYRERDEDEE